MKNVASSLVAIALIALGHDGVWGQADDERNRSGAVWASLNDTTTDNVETAKDAGESNVDDEDADDDDTDLLDEDLLDLDIESLSNVDVVVESFDMEVSSVTKSEGTIGGSPAAIFVLTNEMIRRSGATSLPEALRLVPGITVARLDANKWAISSRGFSGQYANKLLVLQDGRSIYSPVFSGVIWSQHDTVLADIQRIEVIRGPGASVWGANAVNGVINIITKDASQTQGVYAKAGGGSEDKHINSLRVGGQAGNNLHYRIYAKHTERDTGFQQDGNHADDWRMGRVGARADWSSGKGDDQHLTAIGELLTGIHGEYVEARPTALPPFLDSFPADIEARGGFTSLRWQQRLADDSSYYVQGYYDQIRRDSFTQNYRVDILDLEYQFNLAERAYQRLTWGLGYRTIWDDMGPKSLFLTAVTPPQRHTNLFSGFIQDEVVLTDSTTMWLGAKFEHNDFTQFEYQPSVRLLRKLSNRQAIWGAVSRAVRTPSRAETDFRVRVPTDFPPVTSILNPTTAIESEDLLAFEIGYRAQPTDAFAWDWTAFFNQYNDLIVVSALGPPAGFPPTVPTQFFNSGDGDAFGTELYSRWTVSDAWQIASSYSYLYLDLTEAGGAKLANGASYGYAQNQAFIQSLWTVTEDIEFDTTLRYVDQVAAFDGKAYMSLDVRLGAQLTENTRLSLSGQNLLEDRRAEALRRTLYTSRSEVERGIYGHLTWRR